MVHSNCQRNLRASGSHGRSSREPLVRKPPGNASQGFRRFTSRESSGEARAVGLLGFFRTHYDRTRPISRNSARFSTFGTFATAKGALPVPVMTEEEKRTLRDERPVWHYAMWEREHRDTQVFSGETLLDTRVSERSLWLLVGLSGAGKTTLSESLRAHRDVFSIDRIRKQHGWTFATNEWLDLPYPLAYRGMEQALLQGKGVVLDSTGLFQTARERCLDLGYYYDVPVRALVLTTPAEICKERDGRDEDPVSHRFFRNLKNLYEIAVDCQLAREGFDSVHYLDMETQTKLRHLWGTAPP